MALWLHSGSVSEQMSGEERGEGVKDGTGVTRWWWQRGDADGGLYARSGVCSRGMSKLLP